MEPGNSVAGPDIDPRVIQIAPSTGLGMMPYANPSSRVSRAASIASPGSFQGLVMAPSPLVSMTVGHHPWAACSSPVRS